MCSITSRHGLSGSSAVAKVSVSSIGIVANRGVQASQAQNDYVTHMRETWIWRKLGGGIPSTTGNHTRSSDGVDGLIHVAELTEYRVDGLSGVAELMEYRVDKSTELTVWVVLQSWRSTELTVWVVLQSWRSQSWLFEWCCRVDGVQSWPSCVAELTVYRVACLGGVAGVWVDGVCVGVTELTEYVSVLQSWRSTWTRRASGGWRRSGGRVVFSSTTTTARGRRSWTTLWSRPTSSLKVSGASARLLLATASCPDVKPKGERGQCSAAAGDSVLSRRQA